MVADFMTRNAARLIGSASQVSPFLRSCPASVQSMEFMSWRSATSSSSREGTLPEDDPAAPFDPNTLPEEEAPNRGYSSGANKGHDSPTIEDMRGLGDSDGGESPMNRSSHARSNASAEDLPPSGSASHSGRIDDPHVSPSEGITHNDTLANSP